MKRSSLQHLDCSIAQSLDLVGEWWTLLVVRDVFFGLHRFDAIRDDLGISRNILTDRLNTLVEGEVLVRVPIEGGHHEYHLTEKGRDLYPVLIAIMQWGDRWQAPNGAPRVVLHDCGHAGPVQFTCTHCGGAADPTNTRVPRNRLTRPTRSRRT